MIFGGKGGEQALAELMKEKFKLVKKPRGYTVSSICDPTVKVAMQIIAWKVMSVQKTIKGVNAKRRQRSVSWRLTVILLFTVLCWLPLLLCQLLNLLGVYLPEEVAVWMAILILPINASFSPVIFALIPIIQCMRKGKPGSGQRPIH